MTDIVCTTSVEIKAPISKVWKALTEPEQIKKYLFGTDTISDWKVGSPIIFSGVWEGKPYEDKGTILAMEPEKLLKYNYWSNWAGEDILENRQIISYHLKSENGKTVFTLTQENCPTNEARDHSASNWNMVLSSMKEMLEEK
ncbi:MAG: SRPBCC domain-containing protein [Bacteroidetes bacterium]|nr:SRPBCC domain-containing protein [Bacteroidota bacterium]